MKHDLAFHHKATKYIHGKKVLIVNCDGTLTTHRHVFRNPKMVIEGDRALPISLSDMGMWFRPVEGEPGWYWDLRGKMNPRMITSVVPLSVLGGYVTITCAPTMTFRWDRDDAGPPTLLGKFGLTEFCFVSETADDKAHAILEATANGGALTLRCDNGQQYTQRSSAMHPRVLEVVKLESGQFDLTIAPQNSRVELYLVQLPSGEQCVKYCAEPPDQIALID